MRPASARCANRRLCRRCGKRSSLGGPDLGSMAALRLHTTVRWALIASNALAVHSDNRGPVDSAFLGEAPP